MNISKNRFVKVLASAALCCGVVFAQGDDDWFDGSAAQQPAQPAPAQPDQAAPAEDADAAQTVKPEPPAFIDAESNMRLGTEISAQALAAAPFLRPARDPKMGEGRVLKRRDRLVYQKYDNATVKPSSGSAFSFKEGDTVDVLNHGKNVSFGGGVSGQVVTRTGRGVVVGYAGKNLIIRLINVWGTIDGGESIAASRSFSPLYCDKLTTPDAVIRAVVAYRIEDTVTPYLHQHIIINKGSDAGVKLGDIFKVAEREHPNRFSEEILEAQVVNVAPGWATLMVMKLYKDRLKVGDEAFLSLRATAR